MFLNLWFCGEAHASPYLICLIFSLNLCLEVRHMPHLYQTKFYVLNLCFWGEAHALSYLIYLKFSLNLCLEVRHMPHLYQTKFYVLNLYCRGEAHVSPFLTYLNFSLSLWLEMRHMPHPCKRKFHFIEFVFCILWLFLSKKFVFCCDCVKCNVFEEYYYVFNMIYVWL